MSYVEHPRRKLQQDVDIQTMLHMREEGMTNKQIASSLGVSPNTVYRYIGRKSEAVKHAEVQNKPPVVKPTEKPMMTECDDGIKRDENGLTMVEAARKANEERRQKEAEEKAKTEAKEKKAAAPALKSSSLRIVSQRLTLEGELCKYVVDTDNDSIEITDGCLTGLLDKVTLNAIIQELTDIRNIVFA